jgi:hypothetical protein
MGTEMGEDLAAHEARVARLLDRWEALNRAAVPAGPVSTSGIHIHGSGLLAVIVAIIGFVGIVIAVAAVLVVAAWRDADMSDLTRVRGDVRELQAWRQVHADKISKLEAKNGTADTK